VFEDTPSMASSAVGRFRRVGLCRRDQERDHGGRHLIDMAEQELIITTTRLLGTWAAGKSTKVQKKKRKSYSRAFFAFCFLFVCSLLASRLVCLVAYRSLLFLFVDQG
jgi:hypothetical protein